MYIHYFLASKITTRGVNTDESDHNCFSFLFQYFYPNPLNKFLVFRWVKINLLWKNKLKFLYLLNQNLD